MLKEKKQNRRYFIKSAIIGLVVGTVALWDNMITKQKKISSRSTVSLPFDVNKEISFQDDFVIINKEGVTRVFSSRCTHLGCKINQHDNNQLLCPCHGSTFDLLGNATKGPAIKSLEEIKFEVDISNNRITIQT